MEDETIASKANKVVQLFKAIPLVEQDADDQAEDDGANGIEDQFGRFNIWSENIGVFADWHASLDYRLRDSSKAEHLMKELVDGLQLLLRQVARIEGVNDGRDELQTFDSPLEETGSDVSFSLASSSLSSHGSSYASTSEQDSLSPYQTRIKKIEDIIDRLYQLSVIIRKPSTPSRNSKVITTKIVDEEGNDCEAEFVNFASKLVDHRFPNADAFLRSRLSRCIVLRRKQFLYNQRHQFKLRYRGSVDQTVVRQHADVDTSTIVRLQPSGTSLAVTARKATALVAPSRTSATSFAKSKLELKMTLGSHSVISRTMAASSDRVALEPIPSPPKAARGSKEVECPYCCLVIPIKETLRPNWRRHFLNDLAPFVCVYDACDKTDFMFSDRRSWIAHMQDEHTRQWCCIAPGHKILSFDSEDSFEQHMWTEHESAFDETHLPLLKKRAERPGLVFTSCPLCGYDPADQGAEGAQMSNESGVMARSRAQALSDEIAKHVAGHLQSLAMLSLPPWSKDEEEELHSQATAPTLSEGQASNIDDDLGSLHFDSDDNLPNPDRIKVGSISRSYSGSETIVEPSEESTALAEWSFIEPASYIGHNRDPTLQTFLRKLYIESSPYMSEGNGPKLPCHFIPFARNETFFGREHALSEAARVLCPSDAQADPLADKIAHALPRTHAIYGPGGMGKTQVACEFAYRHIDKFDAIFWVHADDKPSLFEDFNSIAIQLRLVSQDSTDARDYTNSRELVKRWLVDPRKDLKDEDSERASWLLIYDGVDDSKIINDFWPYDGPGSVLITSRSPFSWVYSYHLVPFSVEEATNFLLSLTGRRVDSAAKDEVASVNQKLGGLPLALTQMAGLMKQRDMTFPEFVQAYNQRERRQEMLNAKPDESLRPSWYDHNLASVWALEHLSPSSAVLLDTFSMFDPDGISEKLYRTFIGRKQFRGLPAFPSDLFEYKRAKGELLNSSLISGNHSNRKFFVHRIVQDVARMRLSKKQFRDTFMACVELVSESWPFEALKSWRHGTERWATCDELFHHVLRLRELSDSCVPSDDDFDGDYSFVRLLTDAGWYRHERGRSDESNAFNNVAQSVCEVWQDRITAHEDVTEEQDGQLRLLNSTVAEIIHNRGCIATEINAPGRAFKHFEQFNAMMIEQFDMNPKLVEEDMRLAKSWNELGNAYMLQGEWRKGETCFHHSIETMKLLRNFQDIDLSLPLVNLGLSYWLQGEYSKALSVLTKGLEDRERTLGVDDRGSFTKGRFLHALGNVKTSLAEVEEGLSFHRRALQHYKSTLGSNHHRTADLYVKVAEHLIRLKQEETAMALLDHALRAYSNADIYGPEKARAFYMRSRVLQGTGKKLEAMEELLEAARLYAEATGVRNKDPEGLSKVDFDLIISFWSR